jgi:imidazolonepropionase-like amidohydrolase
MNSTAFTAAILFAFLACLPYSFKESKKKSCDLLIQNVGLFDGHQYRGIVDVAIKHDSIVKISKKIDDYTGLVTIDGSGKYMIPGLINSHVHLWQKQDLKEALQAGIFAVIDLHSSEGPDPFFRQLRDSVSYASYYSSGYAATAPKAHPTQLFPIETINDTVSPAQFVENRIKKGADLIKIISGNLKPGSQWYGNPTLSYDQIEETSRVAKRSNKKVVVHVSQAEEAAKIANMGVDGLAHLWSFNDTATSEQLRLLKEKNVFIIPTAIIQKKAWQVIEKNPGGENKFKGSLSTLPITYREIKRVYEAGLSICAGTDPPNFGINYTTDLIEEMMMYAEAGLPNIEVLKTATGNPSTIFQLGGIGKINVGLKANFILLNSDPLKNLSALKDINGIWKNGTRVR